MPTHDPLTSTDTNRQKCTPVPGRLDTPRRLTDVSVCVAYLRVSTTAQAEDGLGLDIQEEAIRSWCTAGGHQLLAVYRDEGISGAKEQADRPGLAAALAAVEDNAEALVVYRLDRLARHLVVQETILEQLGRKQRRVFSVSEADIDDTDPTRVLVRQILGVIAQYERGLIAARLQAGRRLKSQRGGYAGFGSPRFGQRSEDRELAPEPAEQAVIARIVQLRDAGGTLRSITSALNREGCQAKRGGRWHTETVRRVLARIPDQPGADLAA